MAELVRRRSWGGVLPLGRHVSISGSSFIQCASASIAPPHPGGAKCYPGAEVQGRTGSSALLPQTRPKWPNSNLYLDAVRLPESSSGVNIPSHPKRPRHPNQLSKLIVNLSVREAEVERPVEPEKDQAAVSLGRKGGAARAK